MFSKSTQALVVYRTKQLLPKRKGEPGVDDRQRIVPGFNQEALRKAKIIMIGAGGLGGEIGEALIRKGGGRLVLFDYDYVDLTNLNRQLFYKEDLGKPKAHRLARNLAKHGFLSSVIEGYSLSFQDALQQGVDLSADVIVCGVDNNPCRIAVSRYYQEQQIPVIFTAVSEQADHGFVFVQQPGKACFACQFPKAVGDETYHPCSPSVKDILKVVGGLVSYAVDTILMDRLRTWNYKNVYLDGTIPGNDWLVSRRPDCPLCGVPQDKQQTPIPLGQTEGRL